MSRAGGGFAVDFCRCDSAARCIGLTHACVFSSDTLEVAICTAEATAGREGALPRLSCLCALVI